VRGLLNRGYRVIALVEHLDAGRLGTARLSAPVAPDVIVDLLFASCGIELEIVAAAEMVQATAGLSLPVASIGHLVAMKLLARDGMRRPQDLFDLVALRPVLSAEDVADAAAAADLITERGFARDRDLRQLLEDYLAQPPPELPAGFRLR
jgi:membrane-bound lytic murein transglycosylase MltF